MIESIFFSPWIWIMGIAFAVFFVMAVVSTIMWLREWGTDSSWPLGVCIWTLLTLVTGGVYFGGMLPPYDASFYQTYRITGELTEVESAFSGDEGTMSQIFIAKVDGIDLYIKSGDQRFRTLNVGDDVNLVCSKGFAYFQEPWYDCSFGN